MSLNRREFLNLAAASSAATAVSPLFAQEHSSSHTGKIQAIAFDGFVIFDPRSVVERVESMFPGKGLDFTTEWRTRQFEYSWLRTAGHQYVDFWHVTEEALNYTARRFKLELTGDSRARLMEGYRELKPWPDVLAVLAQLKKRNIRMAFLSNFTAAMLDANLAKSNLQEYFEDHLSTDRVRSYKPDPRTYQMGIDAFHLRREQIAFAAFGGWDATGAKWFGYPTVWVNRNHLPEEELGVRPDAVIDGLDNLLAFVNVT